MSKRILFTGVLPNGGCAAKRRFAKIGNAGAARIVIFTTWAFGGLNAQVAKIRLFTVISAFAVMLPVAAAEEADWVRRGFFNNVLTVAMPPDWHYEVHPNGINVSVMPEPDSPSRVHFTVPNPEFGDDIEEYLRANVKNIMEATAEYGEARILEDRDETFGGYPGYLIGFALGIDNSEPLIMVAMGVAHNGYCSMALTMTPRSAMNEVKELGRIVETLRYDDQKLRENADWLRSFINP
ncbi:MAG: hypothetical protein LBT97_01440 [Planctomycetota bacterium]|jgi:hypothetical protein|nr:hypothetical protein [Planctomycetota bacterium]